MSMIALVVLANLLTRGVAIGLGAWVSFKLLAKIGHDLVAIACGLLLGVSTLHLIPEAFESGVEPMNLGWAMTITVLVFVILVRFFSDPHGHDHDQGCGCPQHHHHHDTTPQAAFPLLAGLALHNFVDGVLIATSFLTDTTLGWLVAAAVMGHEIPQSAASLAILKQTGMREVRAVLALGVVALVAVLGSVVGVVGLQNSEALIPYAMAISAASFLFICLTHLLPEVLQDVTLRGLRAVVMVILGVAVSFALMHLGHEHHHHEGHEHAHAHVHMHDHDHDAPGQAAHDDHNHDHDHDAPGQAAHDNHDHDHEASGQAGHDEHDHDPKASEHTDHDGHDHHDHAHAH